MNIYLICTGNTCRSPMAEAILRSRNIEKLVVRSAGIHASEGIGISSNAKVLIEAANMPYTPVSRAVAIVDIEWADVILTMTQAHKDVLIHLFPSARNKIYTIKKYVEPESTEDVQDPFGGSLATYKQTFDELATLIGMLEQKLMEGRE